MVGFSPKPAEAVEALKTSALTDIADTPARAVRGAAMVVLAAPPAATLALVDQVAAHLEPRALVSDVTSIKAAVISRAIAAGLADRFAGAHPLAGTHGSGFSAAKPDRFRGATVYICSTGTPGGDLAARQLMHFWKTVLQAEPVLIDAWAHDRQLAWTSHLPQAVAYVLAKALADRRLGGVSFGPGMRDTTRIAASSPELWVDIFLHNRQPLLDALAETETTLSGLRQLIAAEDAAGLRTLLEDAASFRRTLER